MTGKSFTIKRYIDKFFCHCGKPTKPVFFAKSKDKTGENRMSGMCWQCDDGHVERKWSRKDVVPK